MARILISEKPIQSYEMDRYQYYSPTRFLRLTSNEMFVALRAMGYPYPALRDRLGATWMMGGVDLRILRDVQSTGYDQPVQLYAESLERTKTVFLARITAVLHDQPIADLTATAMAVSMQARHILPTGQVAEGLGAPEVPLTPAAPPRLTLPETMNHGFDLPIRSYDCDRNGHVAGYRYADFVCEAAGYWDQGRHQKADRLRIEYSAECLPGDTLSLYTAPSPEGTIVKGVKQDGRLSFKACLRMDS